MLSCFAVASFREACEGHVIRQSFLQQHALAWKQTQWCLTAVFRKLCLITAHLQIGYCTMAKPDSKGFLFLAKGASNSPVLVSCFLGYYVLLRSLRSESVPLLEKWNPMLAGYSDCRKSAFSHTL